MFSGVAASDAEEAIWSNEVASSEGFRLGSVDVMSTVTGVGLAVMVVMISIAEMDGGSGGGLVGREGLMAGSGKFGHHESLHGSTVQHPAKPFEEQRKNKKGS